MQERCEGLSPQSVGSNDTGRAGEYDAGLEREVNYNMHSVSWRNLNRGIGADTDFQSPACGRSHCLAALGTLGPRHSWRRSLGQPRASSECSTPEQMARNSFCCRRSFLRKVRRSQSGWSHRPGRAAGSSSTTWQRARSSTAWPHRPTRGSWRSAASRRTAALARDRDPAQAKQQYA